MIHNLMQIIPELTTVLVLVAGLLNEIFSGRKSGHAFKVIIPGAWLVLISVLVFGNKSGFLFNNMLQLGTFAFFFKIFFTLVFIALAYLSESFFRNNDLEHRSSEFALISWCQLIGLFFLVSANHFLVMFISLEILTMSLYIMSAYLKKDMRSIESGMKYLILGSLSSGFFIFGLGLLYATSGTLYFSEIHHFASVLYASPLSALAILLIFVGLGFKVACAPFQLWAPDVYQGAPLPVVAFLSIVSKSAGFALLLSVFGNTLAPWNASFTILVMVLAVITMVYGNFGALLQTSIKRLLAYSGIGHAGYMLIALASHTKSGQAAILYYLVAYAISSIAIFYVVSILSKHFENKDDLSIFTGLAKTSPFLASIMFLSLLSLAGVPPFAGFFGKFLVLFAAVEGGWAPIAIVGALIVAVSLYYYLSIVVKMYFHESNDAAGIKVTWQTKIFLLSLVFASIALGLVQEPLTAITWRAIAF